MLERWITAVGVEDAAHEDAAATRERLKERFPKNATRRMTRLGLLVGAALEPLGPLGDDAVVYASTYAESRALEDYLDSFPAASPTLFQTSIHPSAVQQNLILQRRPIREFFPLAGSTTLVAQALLVALLSDAPRVVLCGGEERGSWMLEHGRACDRSFAFALALSTDPAGTLGRISLSSPAAPSSVAPPSPALSSVALASGLCPLSLPAFASLLGERRDFDAVVAPGRRLVLAWNR